MNITVFINILHTPFIPPTLRHFLLFSYHSRLAFSFARGTEQSNKSTRYHHYKGQKTEGAYGTPSSSRALIIPRRHHPTPRHLA